MYSLKCWLSNTRKMTCAPGSLYGQDTTAVELAVALAVELVNRLVVTGLQIMARPLNAGTVLVLTCTFRKAMF